MLLFKPDDTFREDVGAYRAAVASEARDHDEEALQDATRLPAAHAQVAALSAALRAVHALLDAADGDTVTVKDVRAAIGGSHG